MQRLQYRFRPSLRARHTPNSESGKDSSHRGHLFSSISVTSANNVTFVSVAVKKYEFEKKNSFAAETHAACSFGYYQPFLTDVGGLCFRLRRKHSPTIALAARGDARQLNAY
jgi:hypothetical protein